ncbi:MAG: S-layer protein, partial [Candidatus Woesearchaeota archaeon]
GPVQRIEVGRSVLDTEITNVAADNLIVVGGPCANTVAATLLGVSPNAPGCFEDFPVSQGEGIIKMVESGDKVAVIVAGYSAADTRAAAEVLANYEDYADDLEGMDEVVVSGQTIMAPTVAPEPTPEADADEDDSEEDEEGDDDHEESDDENNDEE